MRRLLLLILLLPFALMAASPRFESYRATLHPTEKFARTQIPKTGLNLKMDEYLHYSDNEPLNFADKYTLLDIGCGTGCVEYCLIDRTTGAVYPGTNFTQDFPSDYHGPSGLQFRRNSSLLVVYHAVGFSYPVRISYYVLDGSRMKLLQSDEIQAPKRSSKGVESQVDPALLAAAQKSMPSEIATNQLVRALGSGLWNSNRTALALSITQPKASVVFVFLRQTSETYLAVDASGVEGGNFGKLGRPRTDYERFETTPVEWVYREDGRFMVWMRTRAWRSGKRYTVSEPLLISAKGTVLWR